MIEDLLLGYSQLRGQQASRKDAHLQNLLNLNLLRVIAVQAHKLIVHILQSVA